ncbi:adenylate/guanylate cyclase domain-containing protein [Okeania hirsuta]|uniref:Adenylate/guanylate cyclase domain-containing protein n=2 Tax=Okeania TaxID=1458928 RepID=A0A3N6P5M6_9CYAN|nr:MULTISPECIES: adenylate/guanylate cyclase domain-containing protein [Okeania]NET79314.1 GAF domain-containing protein [Okeania sp. SIO1F9]RQH28206.1 adenylate/guanylate cyclase domain-containing protein [Okeania hirsuta]
MTFSNAVGSILATLTQVDRMGLLATRVKDLPVGEFVCLLEFITAEFHQYLRAIDLINNKGVETLLEQLLDAFTIKIGQILKADQTTIFLVNQEKKQLWYKTILESTGKSQDYHLPINVGILGHVATTGEALNIADAKTHPLFREEVDQPPGYDTRTILCIPVFSTTSSNKPVAVVRLLNKANDVPFDKEDEQLFRSFGDSMGIIIESCQSFYVAARNQRGVSALLKATTTLGQSLDLETTLRAVMDQACNLMQADRSTLFLLSKETNELWTKVATADEKKMVEIRIPANRGIAGYVASTGETLNIPDAYIDPRFDPSTDQKTGYQTRNILCMPVYNAKGELIGVTQLINKNQGSFNSSDEKFLLAFNAQAGIALQNSQLFENVLVEKQYQKDILQSLSDVVISTNMQGRIVTINGAALEMLGCPIDKEIKGKTNRQLWEEKLIGRYVWEVIPIENLQFRLEDSLQHGTRQYVPEQNLRVGSFIKFEGEEEIAYILAVPDQKNPNIFILWGEETPTNLEANLVQNNHMDFSRLIDISELDRVIERSLNLTVNPLTNPEGGVRGGLVVLEDISQEKRMKNTMYRYMTPEVAEQVMTLAEDALLEGERKEVTILFSDIRGYTTLTENLEASEVVKLLNQYFETMVEAVFDHEGTLDKFMGDALMAVFGAPLPLENHALMAVKTALDMRHRLRKFNESRPDRPQFKIGIGISSGEVVSGNIGSKKRMDYTVIGDGVNLSSRLESITKHYGCDIILSEFTYELCRDYVRVRELDKVKVKGKQKSVSIYELIGAISDNIDQETEQFLELYSRARKAYMERNFALAVSYFERAKKMRPDDEAVGTHIQRSVKHITNPPPNDWDGSYTMITK